MVEISSRKELEDWLERQPVEFAIVIAARAALRSVIFAFNEYDVRKDANRAILLPIFRATAAPWVAANYPTQGAERLAHAAALAAADAAHAAAPAAPAAHAAALAAADAALAAAPAAPAAHAADAAAPAADAAALAADAAAAVWKQISADASALENDVASNTMATWDTLSEVANREEGDPRARSRLLAAQPLWAAPDGKLFTEWRRVEKVLRGEAMTLPDEEREALKVEDWDVWLRWYQRRIEGGAWNEALEVERVVSDEIPWDRWSSRNGVRDINAALRAIELKHAPRRAPMTETLKRDPATGLHEVTPAPPRDPGGFEGALGKVRDAMEEIEEARRGNDPYGELDVVLRRLERAFGKYGDDPLRMHDEFVKASKRILSKLERQDLPRHDDLVAGLNDDLVNGAADIRGADAAVDDAVRRRLRMKLRAAGEDEADALGAVAAGKAAASEGVLAADIKEDAETLRAIRPDGTHPEDPSPEDAAYRLTSRLPQIDEAATKKTLAERGVEAADRVGKIDRGLAAGYRWLSYLLDLMG